MRKKQPHHCAHVAAFHAEKARIFFFRPGNLIFGYSGSGYSGYTPSAKWAIESAKLGLLHVKRSVKEFYRAGGAA